MGETTAISDKKVRNNETYLKKEKEENKRDPYICRLADKEKSKQGKTIREKPLNLPSSIMQGTL